MRKSPLRSEKEQKINKKLRYDKSETASTYNSKFSKIHAQIIAEVQARLEWIGADWIDNSDSESDDADGKEGASSAAKTAEHEDRKVRFLDYACGTGSMTRVCFSFSCFDPEGGRIERKWKKLTRIGTSTPCIPMSRSRYLGGNGGRIQQDGAESRYSGE